MPSWQRPDLPARWLRMAQPAYVGRGRQFEALEEAWLGVTSGLRHAVFVGGEAGAGKTRFAVEAALALHEQGVAVLAGSCSDDMGLALDPFVEPAQSFLAGLQASDSGLAATTRSHLDTLTSQGGWDGRDDDLLRSELCVALVDALRVATVPGPVVVVLEDLHWAGRAARDLLKYVVTGTDDLPLLVIATMRSSPPDRSAELSEVVSDLFRLEGVSRLDLPGLDVEEIATYLERNRLCTGREVRRNAAILRDATGGNPFLLRETCRGLGHAAVEWTPTTPMSYATSIASRLTRLPPDERVLVTVAAVMGEETQVSELADAAGRYAGRALTRSAVLTAIGGLKTAGLLDPGVTSARFAHALARDAVVATLSDLELARMHEAIARALEVGHPTTPRRTVRLAAHFSGAAVLGHEREAARYLTEAGDQARAASAHVEAADCYERAASFAEDATARDRSLLAAARSALLGGQLDRSRALNESVISGGVRELLLQAAIGHAATAWRDGVDARRSRELLRTALAEDPDAPDELQVHATASLARLEAWSGRPATGRRLGSEARARARALGNSDLALRVLSITMNDGSGFDELDEVIERAEELSRLGAGRRMAGTLGPGAYHRCAAHYQRGHPEAFAVAVRDLQDIADSSAQPFWAWVSGAVTFGLALSRAQLDRAAEELTSMRHHDQGRGSAGDHGPEGMMNFALRRESGLPPSARAFLGRPGEAGVWAPAALALATELREEDLAAAWLAQVMGGDLSELQGSASWPATLSFLVDATVLLADVTAAERLVPLVERYAGHNLLAAEFLHPLGSADLPLARLLSLLGRPGAVEHFDAAVEMGERMGATLHLATALAAYARHATLHPVPGLDPGRLVASARELADRYGLVRVQRDLDELAAHGRPRWGLTPREQEVLGLLAHGLSNREISEALVISEHTAANHVRSILMKTDSTNRTQAAVLADGDQPTPVSEPLGRTR